MSPERYAAADLVDRPFRDLFAPGELVAVRLCCGQIFEGALERAGRDHLELCKVRESGNPNVLPRSYTFYRNEIDRIERTRSVEINGGHEQDGGRHDQDGVDRDDDGTTVKMDEVEYRRLKDVSRNYTYVDSYEDVPDLSDYESLGLAALGLLPDRIPLLAIGTWDRVYVYDTLVSERLIGSLRNVLESGRVCKVMHRAGPTVEVLRRRYGTTVRNYFDTETVDMMVQRMGSNRPICPRDVSRCLVAHFNFPERTMKEALLTREEKWRRTRPLTDRRLLYASQLVTYLIPLRDELRRTSFGHVIATSEKMCDYVYDLDTYRFSRQAASGSITIDDEIDGMVSTID